MAGKKSGVEKTGEAGPAPEAKATTLSAPHLHVLMDVQFLLSELVNDMNRLREDEKDVRTRAVYADVRARVERAYYMVSRVVPSASCADDIPF